MNRVSNRIKDAKNLPLLGVTVHTYNPAFVEMVGMLGYDVIWIEAEHMANSVEQVCNLCRVAEGVGLLTMIRIPDSRRESVLKAAECGPDIIDLPMGNSLEIVEEFVNHSRFMPEGNRGVFSCSRALKYGIYNSLEACQKEINNSLCLMSQVETKEAVEQLDKICSVKEINGIFIGPGDLSASLGFAGKPNNPVIINTINHVIRTAKNSGKLVALAYGITDYKSYITEDIDILFCLSDITCMREGLLDTKRLSKTLYDRSIIEQDDRII